MKSLSDISRSFVNGSIPFVTAYLTAFSGEVIAFSEHDDFVSLSIDITPDKVISLMLEIYGDLIEKILRFQLFEDVMTSADKQVIDSVIRLLSLSRKKRISPVYGKSA